MLGPKYSVIVPVYNRPDEVDELLASLTSQTFRDFDVVIVEDGSTRTSRTVYEKYASRLKIDYYVKPNSGPGPSRNFGFEKAKGENFVVFDSDCVIPPKYFEVLDASLNNTPLDLWGGPDRGHGDFTLAQQAMAYSMSSLLTTGGIRGGKASNFQPRSFNLGMTRAAWEKTRGFVFDRYAEDIELSVRARKLGLRVGLVSDAYVYHKRRATFSQFFRQVANFGRGRVHVNRAHPGAIKLTHWFPAVFLIGLVSLPLALLVWPSLGVAGASIYAVYLAAVGIDCWSVTRRLTVAVLSIPAAVVQLTGYGFGFLVALAGK